VVQFEEKKELTEMDKIDRMKTEQGFLLFIHLILSILFGSPSN